MIKKLFIAIASIISVVSCTCAPEHQPNELRAPAYPLITIDPYTSAWSTSDKLYESVVKHWTGNDFPFLGVLTVDGKSYRFMGVEKPVMEVLVPDAAVSGWTGRYTNKAPEGNWYAAAYNDSSWKTGKGSFSTPDDCTMGTQWDDEHIWIRRTFELGEGFPTDNLFLLFSNDDDAEYYINGHLVAKVDDCFHYETIALSPEVVASLHEGTNTIAATCWNKRGPGIIDFGILRQDVGAERFPEAATQQLADVQAMNTYYSFTCGPVDLNLRFTAPLFMEELDLLSRPVNYVSYDLCSNDGAKHNVNIYFEASPAWSVNLPYQRTQSSTYRQGGFVYCKAGSESQNVLGSSGDDRRIDWGYFYMAADGKWSESLLPNGNMGLAMQHNSVKKANGYVMIGYDDLYSIQYFGQNLRPYWNRSGAVAIEDMFEAASREYDTLMDRSMEFDRDLLNLAQERGGRHYAELCALAYRQAVSAHKLVESPDESLLWLSKENNSNGCIGTVDVTYPSAPLFLIYNPELAKGLLNHIFYYSESGRWTKPFPAHDIGTYPLANGQVYGADMPVEEAGNMLTLTLAAAHFSDDINYIREHWETLTTWTEYLAQFGLDPDNQLCTDDFAGHLAHNVNLSAKAIMGIASYARMAHKMGFEEVSDKYFAMAREMASKWMEMSSRNDHYSLTFDSEDSWSQKYNLVWDKLLGLNVFPEDVMATEIRYYLGKQNIYGLPLDSRKGYTKTDWIVWTASMADIKADFEKLVDPVYKFMNETVDRVPMSDWIETENAHRVGFMARSVVGGYFIPLLEQR